MTNDDLNSLIWPAVRYALGRKTYVVDTVARAAINNAKNIRNDIRYKIGEEIEGAINKGQAGMDCDVRRWNDVLDAFSKVIE